jgi:hypothetical protein
VIRVVHNCNVRTTAARALKALENRALLLSLLGTREGLAISLSRADLMAQRCLEASGVWETHSKHFVVTHETLMGHS